MDSKIRGLTITVAILFMTVIVGIVITVNDNNNKKNHTETSTNKVSDNNADSLHAFLEDETFFDPDPGKDYAVFIGDEKPHVFVSATSVFHDIRVNVTDESGKNITGENFTVVVDGQGEYTDVDKDGLIIIPDLSAGAYFITLKNVMNYYVPIDPVRVSVKDMLEYKVINDIEGYLLTEAQIDALEEDTGVNEADSEQDETEITEIKKIDSATFGIDVSKYQGEIDWAKVKAAGVNFAIIRAGYRGSKTGAIVKDPYFEKNIKGAKDAGILVGAYFFTQAVSEIEAVEEASAAVSLIKDYGVEYPIFIDTEGAGGNGRADNLDVNMRTAVCKAFCMTVQNAGYHSGVYASRNWYKNMLNASELERYVVWDAEYTASPKYDGKFDIWQYSSKGLIDGISTRVDLDLSYIEFN